MNKRMASQNEFHFAFGAELQNSPMQKQVCSSTLDWSKQVNGICTCLQSVV